LALGLVATLGACAWWAAGRHSAEERISFSHQLHAEQGTSCETCHPAVAEANDLNKSLKPTQGVCVDCHSLTDCKACAALPKERPAPELDERTLAFTHKNHLERVKGDCTKCHANAKTAEKLPIDLPAMSVCLGCHNHAEEYEASRCQRCHPVLDRFPLEAVAEFNHAGNWIERHGMLARSEGSSCVNCHPQAMCTNCHSKVAPAAPSRLYPEYVERAQMHKGDFLTQHSLDARAEGELCFRCHDSGYCQQCHNSWGLVNQPAGNPHPKDWLLSGNPNGHGPAARQRIDTCAACHDQGGASICIQCHKSYGPNTPAAGGNPHPPGFSNDRTRITNNRACTTCHQNG
jgi:predicted CXXCH cytochrome family protein